MNFRKYLVPVLLVALLVISCSEKQEEAAQLEQELLDQQDTTAEMAEAVADTEMDVTEPDPAAEEGEYTTPPVPQGAGYTVQVAGCEDRDYAEHLIQTYTARGYEPYVTTAEVEGQTYYRVRIGSFETVAEAKVLKAQLADRYSIEVWIDYIQ